MTRKKYSSYAEIDQDLEILRIEKEIEYHRLVIGLQQTRESFTPQNMIRGFLTSLPAFSWREVLQNSYGSLLNMAIPFVMGWLAKKKGGH